MIRLFWRLGPAAVMLIVTLSGAAAHGTHPAAQQSPTPSGDYVFPLAAPGSYRLPPIKRAGGGTVLDEQGRPRDLADLLRGPIALLAFIYTRCGDVCPLATMRMAELREVLALKPQLAKGVRLISLSFDPDYDTPARMAEHAALWRDPKVSAPEWLFLTTPDWQRLQPLLEAYGQTLAPAAAADDPNGVIKHILRVFLIDGAGQIRNIYSLDFLDPALIVNDIETLRLQRSGERNRR